MKECKFIRQNDDWIVYECSNCKEIMQVNELLEKLTEEKEKMEEENISEKFVSYDIIYSSLQIIHCLDEKLKFINYSSNEYEDKIKMLNEIIVQISKKYDREHEFLNKQIELNYKLIDLLTEENTGNHIPRID